MKKVKDIIEKIEKKSKPKKGGARPGSGRKKGKLSQVSIDRLVAEKEMKQRILQNLHPLLNAQLNVARGATYMYKIVESGEGKNKKREHILVTDPSEIKDILDETDGACGASEDGEYYYMTTKAPDNRALDSLLDRAFGRARQNIGLDGGEEGKPIEHKITSILDKIQDGN